jgi:hypothetical protein
MSMQVEGSQQRAYSPEEIESRLHFIKLPKPIELSSTSGTSTPTIEWWPCLVFANMRELYLITQQLEIWTSLSKHQMMITYMKLLPASATCRVALLTGERPPPGNSVILFEIINDGSSLETYSSLIVEPFYEKVFQFHELYAQSEDFLKAVQQTLPVIQEVEKSLRISTNDRTTQDENCNLVNSNMVATFNKEENQTIGSLPNLSSTETSEILNVVATTQLSTINVHEEKEVTLSDVVLEEKQASTNKAPMPLSNVTLKPPIAAVKHRSKNASHVNKNLEFVEIPTFNDVKGTLMKGGYTFHPKKFCRPPIALKDKSGNSEVILPRQCFESASALREDLCIYGVNCRCGTSMDEDKACQCWTDDEKWDIKLWVRYNVIRGPINVSCPVQVISSIHEATKYLIRIGYQRRQLESSLTTSEQINDLFRYLSQHGLPKEDDRNALSCDYSAIGVEERFSLEYFISTNRFRVKTLYVEDIFVLSTFVCKSKSLHYLTSPNSSVAACIHFPQLRKLTHPH